MSKGLLAIAVTVLLAAAPALAQGPAAATTAAGAIEIRDAWARATPGGADNGAAYLTLRATEGDRLTGVSTPAAKQAGLHEMATEGGIMKMRALDGIDLPAGQPVTLKPGGKHIMLLGLTAPLRPGQSFPLTLHFAKAGTREVDVAVGRIGDRGPQDHAGGDMPMPPSGGR